MTLDKSPYLDWSVVSDEYAEAALEALLTVPRMRERWDGISAETRRVHHLILRSYLTTAQAPSLPEIASHTEQSVRKCEGELDDLKARDLIVYRGGKLLCAYPFSTIDTTHSVLVHGVRISVACIIDGLGVAAMTGLVTRVSTSCPVCTQAITVRVAEDGLQVEEATPPETVVLARVTPVGACAADTQCKSMLAFCSPEHLTNWNRNDGEIFCLTPAQAVQVGAAIFRPFLKS